MGGLGKDLFQARAPQEVLRHRHTDSSRAWGRRKNNKVRVQRTEMKDITSSNTHHNGAKGGRGYGPHGPKVWWVVVACETRRKERSETWLDRVCHKNKNNDKNQKKYIRCCFCFPPFFCKNGLCWDRPWTLLVKHQELAFGPQQEADSLSLLDMGSDRSI